MPDIELKPLPFEEAIEAFRDLVPLTADEFYALAAEARALAFTVSGVMRMDVLVDLHTALDTAISEGETLADFRNRLDEIFETRGWAAPPEMTPWRMETIFRTNVQTAYSTGKYKQMVAEKEAFPNWEYDAVNDSRTRPTHAALDGMVFPADHPFWDTWYPPNGYNCRCSVNPVHKSEEIEVETDDPTNGLIEPVDPVTGERMPARPLVPDPGWGRNPAKERWRPEKTAYPAELVQQTEEAIWD
jgi:SPP1 gp7 family putative phage head morphogenesis protein